MLVRHNRGLASDDAAGTEGSGGTETTYGDYKVHTFLTSGTFTVTSAGNIDVLVVAGGGGGTGSGNRWGGGGGVGGLVGPGVVGVVVVVDDSEYK